MGEAGQAPGLKGPRTVLALPALQAVPALLAEFSGPSPFPLAVFAVPFLAPCKANCTHREGDTLHRAEPAELHALSMERNRPRAHRKPAPSLLPSVSVDIQVVALSHCQMGCALQLLEVPGRKPFSPSSPGRSKQLTIREELCFCRVEVEVTSTGVLGVRTVGHHRS